ncbi:MAG: Ig-like domain-containing protein [Candidatus Micrarchaeota archaeon]
MKTIYFVLLLLAAVFAVPSGLVIEINNLDPSTNTTAVQLTTLTAIDADNCSISNHADLSGATTLPYSSITTPMAWTLTSNDGTKTVYFRCDDVDGNMSDVASASILLNTTVPDTVAPTISGTVPTGTTTNKKPAINATITDTGGSGVDSASIQFSLDGSPVTGTFTSGTGKLTYTPASNLALGIHNVSLDVSDLAGNPATQATWSFTVTSTGVSFSSLTPTNGSTTSDVTPTISAHVTSSDGVGNVTMKLNSASVNASYASGVITYTPTVSNGNYTVLVEATDSYGTPGSVSWTFIVSSAGVSFGTPYPADGSSVSTRKPNITVHITDSGSGINTSSIRMRFNDSDVNATYSATTGNVSYTPATNLPDGSYDVTVTAVDNAGVSKTISWTFSVLIDNTAPDISLFIPSNNSAVNNFFEISAVIEDGGTGVNEGSIMMNLNDVDVSNSVNFNSDTGKATFTPTVTLTGGEYQVDLWAKDNAGNERHVKWYFTIPSAAPLYSSKTPEPGSFVTNKKPEISVIVKSNGTSAVDATSIKMYFDGSVVTPSLSGSTGKVSFVPAANLSEGSHTAKVMAKNLKGEESQTEWSFTIDSITPNPPTNLKANVSAASVLLTWAASNSSDVVKYKVFVSPTSFLSIANKISVADLNSSTLQYVHSQTGKYYYAVVAVDGVGNPSAPAFAATCSAYSNGAWSDYECCVNSDCGAGKTCEAHVCKISSAPATQNSTAKTALDAATLAIRDARESGKNTTQAEEYLQEAQNSFNAKNYEEANRFAQLAKEAALSAPGGEPQQNATVEETGGKKPLPCLGGFVLLGVLAFLFYQRR